MKNKGTCEFSSFENEWLKVFASNVSKKDIDKHVKSTGNLIWHVFSWNLLPKNSFLVGDDARKAFDAEDKTNAQYYEPWPKNGISKPEYISPLSYDLDQLTECYVISADKKWTYIKTHEKWCGPYFYKIQD